LPVDKTAAEAFVKVKHYSRRGSIFWAAFGLEENGLLEGVVVYGQPSPPIQRHAFKDRDFRLFELARLVVQTKTPNAASYLVGQSLRRLPAPCAVVSYADEAWGHAGVVYQATNWLYTGATVSHDHLYLVGGEKLHPMTLRDRGITNPKQWAAENGVQTVKPAKKHRYFYLVGSKKERREMRQKLTYPVLAAYPKRDATRYDDGPRVWWPASGMTTDMGVFG
jgi:hypothetical protein